MAVKQEIKTKEQYLAEGFDPQFFENNDYWEKYMCLSFGIKNINQLTLDHLTKEVKHLDKRCFRSIYSFTKKQENITTD